MDDSVDLAGDFASDQQLAWAAKTAAALFAHYDYVEHRACVNQLASKLGAHTSFGAQQREAVDV